MGKAAFFFEAHRGQMWTVIVNAHCLGSRPKEGRSMGNGPLRGPGAGFQGFPVFKGVSSPRASQAAFGGLTEILVCLLSTPALFLGWNFGELWRGQPGGAQPTQAGVRGRVDVRREKFESLRETSHTTVLLRELICTLSQGVEVCKISGVEGLRQILQVHQWLDRHTEGPSFVSCRASLLLVSA